MAVSSAWDLHNVNIDDTLCKSWRQAVRRRGGATVFKLGGQNNSRAERAKKFLGLSPPKSSNLGGTKIIIAGILACSHE